MFKSRSIFATVMAGFMVCLAYGCSPSYPECYDDNDCTAEKSGKSANEYCLNAKCAECRNDEHCSSKRDESYICNSGSCQRINGYCNPEVGINCPAGQKCRDRRCGPECYPETVAEDCPENYLCENNRCVPSPSASSTKIAPLAKSAKTKSASMRPFANRALRTSTSTKRRSVPMPNRRSKKTPSASSRVATSARCKSSVTATNAVLKSTIWHSANAVPMPSRASFLALASKK